MGGFTDGDGSWPDTVDYAALFALSPRAALVLSPELLIRDVNAAALALTGNVRESLVGRRLVDAFPPDARADARDRDGLAASLARVLGERRRDDIAGQRYDIPRPGGGGVDRYWDFAAVPILRDDEVVCILLSVDDATDRVHGARAAEARFDAAFEQHVVGIAHVGLDGDLLRVNSHLCHLLGHDAEALLRHRLGDILHPDDIAAGQRQFDLLLGGAQAFDTSEKRYLRADGTPLWVNETRSLVRGATGEPEHFAVVVDDISDRKATETILREREIRLRAILETVPDGMVVIDQNGIVESFSRTAEQMFGYEASEVVGHNITMLMPDPDRDRHDGYIRGYLETSIARIIGHGRAVAGRRKDGSLFNHHLCVGEVLLGDRRMFVGFVRDLTERQRTEARVQELQGELAHLSRLTALGEMASALAHEVNQPLTAIASLLRGCGRLLELGLDGRQHLLADAIEDAGSQALRAGQIIRRLRDFVTRGENVRRDEPVADLIEEACGLALVGTAERGLRASSAFDPAAPVVRVDRIQIQQVVVNLVRNAAEAMQGQDVSLLRITTTGLPDGMVEVEVEDNGPGLAPEVADRLFQPFVTTKSTGMGVGLSICRTIIEAHDGRIGAYRNDAGGTTFWFTLPGSGPDGA